MIDTTQEQLIRLADAARLIPPARRGKKTHESTVLRWILTGTKAPDGSTVRLDGIRLGGKWLTSREALQRFGEALTPDLATGAGPERRRFSRPPRTRQR